MIGPDGAGKTTLLEELPAVLAVPVKCIYMGMRFESSHTLLPSTRLLLALRRARGAVSPLRHGASPEQPRIEKGIHRLAALLRSMLLLLNLFAEEWYRQFLAWIYQRRGYLVVFDRHFLADFYAFDGAGYHGFGGAGNGSRPPLGTRLHGLLLERFYPRPDLVIYLDAPAAVFLARKGEGTVDQIEGIGRAHV